MIVGELDLMEVLGLAHLYTGRAGQVAKGDITGVSQGEGGIRGEWWPPRKFWADVDEMGPIGIVGPTPRAAGGPPPTVVRNVRGVN